MTISIHPELQAFVEGLVKTGRFASAEAAVEEAIRSMKTRDERREWLRREIQKGVDSAEQGRVSAWDFEDLKAELRAMAEREGQVG